MDKTPKIDGKSEVSLQEKVEIFAAKFRNPETSEPDELTMRPVVWEIYHRMASRFPRIFIEQLSETLSGENQFAVRTGFKSNVYCLCRSGTWALDEERRKDEVAFVERYRYPTFDEAVSSFVSFYETHIGKHGKI